MALFELNIYGNDDEILKKHETNRVRWGVYLEAIKLSENGLGDKPPAEQFELINGMMLKIFPNLTIEELEFADADDIINTFMQLISKGKNIQNGGSNSKNAVGVK